MFNFHRYTLLLELSFWFCVLPCCQGYLPRFWHLSVDRASNAERGSPYDLKAVTNIHEFPTLAVFFN